MTTESYHTFLSLLRFPVNSNKVVERAKSSLNKVFDGRNKVEKFVFRNPDHEDVWRDYRDTLNFDWRKDGLTAMCENIESFMVIDMPKEQTTHTPEPYMYLVDVDNARDFDKKGGDIIYLFYELEDDRYAFLDNEYYHILTNSLQGYEFEDSIKHEYGYCPAKHFWSDRMSSGIAKSPFTNELTDLDRYVQYDVWNEYLNGYARFPFYWGYEQHCEYSTEELSCDGGYMMNKSNSYTLGADGRLQKCPKCSDRRFGVGSYFEVPTPESEDSIDMRPPIGMIEPNVDGLEFNKTDLKDREEGIISRVTGHAGELIKKESVNTEQVLASFDGELTVINRIKSNFEIAQQWSESTMCIAKFGDSFVSASISYGTEFYTHTYDQLGVAYSYGLKNGWDSLILDMLQDEMHNVKYKNDPDSLMRAKINNHLDPLRHVTKAEAQGLCEKGIITTEDYFVKMNLSSLIMRFELEHIDIVEFGNEVDFKIKIKNIKNKLYEYAKESTSAGQTQSESRERRLRISQNT